MNSAKRILSAAKIIILLFLLNEGKLQSQTYYSTDPDYLRSKYSGNNILTNFQSEYPDTTLVGFHQFFPRNFLGNYGLPSPNYLLSYGTDAPGFRFYELPYQNARFKPEEIKFYRSKGPYAELTGIAGSKQLQIFKLLFVHTYKRVNVTLRFNRYTSQGFYLRQQSFTNNFYLSSNFTSANQRIGYYFYFLNNGNRHNENGGIKSDSLTEISLLQGKDILPVKLTNASRDNKEYTAAFNPWFKLNKGADSVNAIKHYIQLNSSFNTELYQYKDQGIYTDKFYLLMYHDTARTFDSSRVFRLSNGAAYALKTRNENFGFSAGYKNEFNKVWQKTDSSFLNHIAHSDIVFRKSLNSDSLIKHYYESRLNAGYIFSGVSSGDYKIEAINNYGRGSSLIYLKALFEKRHADYIYNYWVSNHFQWFNNGYSPQEKLQLKAGYEFKKVAGVSVLLNSYRNYLYFDEVALPRQYSSGLQALAANAFVSATFFKHIGLYTDYTYQSVSNSSYLRVPQHSGTFRIFYRGAHFKNNLILNTGAQLQMYSSFFGYAYMPASNVFYLQETFKTTPYPFVDVYLNARIRPVNIFVKIENVLQGFAGTGYSFVPGYYQPDRAFRFGISWMFFD